MGKLNTTLIQQRFTAALPYYDQHAVVQRQIVAKLTALLQQQGVQQIEHCLEIGCGSGGLTQSLNQHFQIKQWDICDLCDCTAFLNSILPQGNFRFQQGDAEQYHSDTQYDLIATASTLQWFQDPQGFVQRSASSLKPQGWLLFSTFAPDNLAEIKQLTGIGLDYPSLADWQQWLKREFELVYLSQTQIRLAFDHPKAVLHHLKATGVTATTQHIWTKHRLNQFYQQYSQNYLTEHQQVSLTYTPLYGLVRRR